MIVWLNGPFGAGKTTTAKLLLERIPRSRIFDSEHIGFMLRPIIDDIPCDDFKEWKPWRGLTIETARQVLDFVGGTLVIPQTVTQRGYWSELSEGFAAADIPMRAFTLHAERDTFVKRVEADAAEPESTRQWRLELRDAYETALEWMAAETTVVNTTHLSPEAVADRIASAVTS